MSDLAILPPGTKVHPDPDDEVEGHIVRVLIDASNFVRYRVAYWSNGKRHEETMMATKLSVVDEDVDKQPLGYLKRTASPDTD